MIKAISWNVNGIRAVLKKGFLEWFNETKPDILCLQESRALPSDVSNEMELFNGYKTYWHPAQKKGYSGVCTFSKKDPISVRTMGIDEFDNEGRVQALEYKDFFMVNAYFPNSQSERARIDYKLSFCESMTAFCNKLRDSGKHVVLCGDYNIAHEEIDLARPKQNVDNPGFLPEEREAMTKFLNAGYVDTFRHFNKEPENYTWWSYRFKAREKNLGWRIDYHCVNKEFLPKIKKSEILSNVMGSDHCPVSIMITGKI